VLQKAKKDPSCILPPVLIEIHEDLTIEMKPIKILDQSLKELRNKKVPLVKVLWGNSRIKEETWERE
jgi:hypothetical protein